MYKMSLDYLVMKAIKITSIYVKNDSELPWVHRIIDILRQKGQKNDLIINPPIKHCLSVQHGTNFAEEIKDTTVLSIISLPALFNILVTSHMQSLSFQLIKIKNITKKKIYFSVSLVMFQVLHSIHALSQPRSAPV